MEQHYKETELYQHVMIDKISISVARCSYVFKERVIVKKNNVYTHEINNYFMVGLFVAILREVCIIVVSISIYFIA